MLAPVPSLRQKLGESGGAFRDVARNPGLRRLSLAFTGSEVGGWGYSLAILVLAFEAGGAAALGLLTFVLMVTPAVASPFTALLGDRFERARVMLTADLIRAFLMGVAAVVAFTDSPTWFLYVLAGLSGITSTAFRPAQAAILPSLARTPAELTAANVVSSTVESVTVFAGPAIGGAVLAATEPGVSFAIAGATFLWSAALIGRIQLPPQAEEQESEEEAAPEGIGQALAAGARAVFGEPRVRLLVGVMGAQTLAAGTLLVFVPVVALDLLDAGEEGLGSLYSALGVGGLVGALAAAALVGRRRLAPPFALGTILWGAPFALLALWDSLAGALVLLAVIGLANTVVDVSAYTLLQRAVPDAVLARVFGILESVILGTVALGGVLASLLVEAFGLRPALLATGAFLPVVVALLWRPLLRIDGEAPPPERELELLRGVPFLALLPPATLAGLAARLEPVAVAAGEPVFAQGDPGDRFYVIANGEAEVRLDRQPARRLVPGDFFGEIALLHDLPRTATVRAVGPLELFALERGDFLAALTGHAPSRHAAWAVVETRLGASEPVTRA
jgi:MFS family permease